MNEEMIIDEYIKLVDEEKITDFLSENKIRKRQCMIFIISTLFSLFIRYNDFIKKV